MMRFFQCTDNLLVSPGDTLPEKEFIARASDRSKYYLPHYVSGLLLSRNIEVEFRELSSSAVYQAIQQSMSSSKGFSVCGFWGSTGAFSHNTGKNDKSHPKVESSDTGLRIKIPGVQVIGYFTQNVPMFPKP